MIPSPWLINQGRIQRGGGALPPVLRHSAKTVSIGKMRKWEEGKGENEKEEKRRKEEKGERKRKKEKGERRRDTKKEKEEKGNKEEEKYGEKRNRK